MGVLQFKRGDVKPALQEGEPFFDTDKRVLHVGEKLSIGGLIGVYHHTTKGDVKRYELPSDLNDVDVQPGDIIVIGGGTFDMGAETMKVRDGAKYVFVGNPKIIADNKVFTDDGNEVEADFIGPVQLESRSGLRFRVEKSSKSLFNGLKFRFAAYMELETGVAVPEIKIIENTLAPGFSASNFEDHKVIVDYGEDAYETTEYLIVTKVSGEREINPVDEDDPSAQLRLLTATYANKLEFIFMTSDGASYEVKDVIPFNVDVTVLFGKEL